MESKASLLVRGGGGGVRRKRRREAEFVGVCVCGLRVEVFVCVFARGLPMGYADRQPTV